MLNSITESRNIVIKHAMQKVLEGNLTIDQFYNLTHALNEEYELVIDSLKRWEKNCYLITEGRTVILSGKLS